MTKILLIIIGVLVLVTIILCISIHFLRSELKSMQENIETIVDANTKLHDEIKRLNSVDKIKSDNRRESDEKINDLYNGDVVDNAIDELRNNKNN